MFEAAAGARDTRERPWLIFAVAASSIFLVLLDTTVLYIVFPAIRRAFPGSSPATLSWTINAYTILFAALLVPAGRVADLKGRKLVFVGGLAIFAAGAFLSGVAPTVPWLIGARAIQAVGAASITPSSLALSLAAFPTERRAFLIGWWGAVSAIAATIGPPLGALIIEGAGWRWVFLGITGPFALFFALLAARLLPDLRSTGEGRMPDLASVLLLVAGVAALAFGTVESRNWGVTAASTLAVLGAGVVLLALFLWDARRKQIPAIDVRLFGEPNFRNANVAILVYGAAFAMMFFGCLLFPQQVWHYNLAEAALAFAPGPFLVIPFAILAGRFAQRHGHRALFVVGGLVFAGSGAWFYWMAPLFPSYLVGWLPGVAMTGVGVGLLVTALTGAAVARLPKPDLGVGSGANQAIRQIGAALGVALVVAFVGGGDAGNREFGYVFLGIVIGGLVCALFAAAINTRPPAARNAR
jgi:MFS family permease